MPKAVDVNVEYLRSGRPVDTYARAVVKKIGPPNRQRAMWRLGRRIGRSPIAALHGHFLITPQEPADPEPGETQDVARRSFAAIRTQLTLKAWR